MCNKANTMQAKEDLGFRAEVNLDEESDRIINVIRTANKVNALGGHGGIKGK